MTKQEIRDRIQTYVLTQAAHAVAKGEKENGTSARAFLETWCRDALNSGVKHLAKVAKTLAAYRSGLLNYFKHPITSAMVEGINNKIKTLKRQAYGFRDQEYFKLRLYHLHTQRYSLTG